MAEEEVITQEQTESSKPDYVQDKFWNKDTNEINIEELSSSYNSLEKKLGARTEDLSKQIREDIANEVKANVPEKYEINMPEIPENIQMDINPEMPLLQWWSDTAKAKGLSQEEFNKGIEAFVNNEISSLPDTDNERELLGENANQRIEAADLWSKKNLSSDSYEAIAEFASTAKGVKALEEIMKLNKDAPIPQTETAIEAAPSLEDLRSMMKDPRYWKDGERDQAYINKVSALYEKYYGSQKAS
mgnify:CR=1 FL=1|jgi:hypothetical protein|tara:strand:+ start:719 stop:1453 length:735 start_codon:yes stop_codon:yes gene_type:complete